MSVLQQNNNVEVGIAQYVTKGWREVCVCVWGGGIKVLKASAEGDESASGGRLLHLPVVQGKDSFLYKGIADR